MLFGENVSNVPFGVILGVIRVICLKNGPNGPYMSEIDPN